MKTRQHKDKLSLLMSSRSDSPADKDTLAMEAPLTSSIEHSDLTSHSLSGDASEEGKTTSQNLQDDESIPAKEEIKRMIEDTHGFDKESTTNSAKQPGLRSSSGKSSNLDFHSSPNKRSSKAGAKVAMTSEGELSLSKDLVGGKGRNPARGNPLFTGMETISSQSRKIRASGLDSFARSGIPGPVSNKRQPVTGLSENQPSAANCAPMPADSSETNMWTRPILMLQNRFPTCLLDMAQDFFAAGL